MRAYRGHGFTLQVPDAWVDQTIFTLAGWAEGEIVHRIWIVPDLRPRVADLKGYAAERNRRLLESPNGWFLAQEKGLDLAPGLPAWRCELRWSPADGQRLFQRQLFVGWQKTIFALSTQMTRFTKGTKGVDLDKAMGSIRPSGFREPAGAAPPAGETYQADLFTMRPGEGWKDETIHLLAEPDDTRFRRNLVVERRPIEEDLPPLDKLADAEIESLALSVKGFEPMDSGPFAAKDGGPAHRLVFHRATPKGGGILRQECLLAPREGKLFFVALTTESKVPERDRPELAAILAGFAAGAAAAAPGGAPAGAARAGGRIGG